ncbi:RNA polymerase sigma factor SigJ [Ilumatobacter nonamiensis]|uniref:RNA polymerase sigma factor SigJ n=1 Tax=Ilumatobacter nonamiensis TaxID=467093 RepID=UPI000349EF89|nr:RNA polymerase sigma factor SigJ [Ilumatobacter nonamiensis]
MSSQATEFFEAERPRLMRLAYRMLGTPDDADDVVQDAWLRWQGTTLDDVENPAAWLTTVTTRLSIDRLTSARRRRETYVGPWIPEPLTVDPTADSPIDPAASAIGGEGLELGLLRVLETLGPVERAVFLLHDVFGYPFDEVATVVGKSVPATRQTAKRARDRVRSGRPRIDPEPDDVDKWSAAFLGAVVNGDVDELMAMMTDDVVHISDGGAERHAARRPVVGADRVARLLINLTNRDLRESDELHWLRVNGQTGLYIVRDGEPFLLNVIGWRDGRVAEFLTIVNPDKLARFHERWRA